MRNDTIRAIYNVEELKGDDYSLVKWHNDVINKTVDELTCADVARMLRQGLFLETALSKAIEMLMADPFVGELYTGELIESLSEVDRESLSERKSDINNIVKEAEKDINSVPWGYPEEKNEYMEMLVMLKSNLE